MRKIDEDLSKYYTTSHVTEQTGLTDFTLRKYLRILELKGINIRRNEYGHRLYSSDNIAVIEALISRIKEGERIEEAAQAVMDDIEAITAANEDDTTEEDSSADNGEEITTNTPAMMADSKLLQTYINIESERIELQREQLQIDKERLQIERNNSQLLADILERLDGIDTVTDTVVNTEHDGADVDMTGDDGSNERNGIDSEEIAEEDQQTETDTKNKRGFFGKIADIFK